MPLKTYSELSAEETRKVSVMYSDHSTLAQFLYNFDESGNFHGRQYAPPAGVVRADPVTPSKPAETLKADRALEIGKTYILPKEATKELVEALETENPAENPPFASTILPTPEAEKLYEEVKSKPKRTKRTTKK